MQDLLTAVQSVGVPVALVIFFVWRDQIREARMTKRMDANEEFIRSELLRVVQDNSAALRENAEARRELVRELRVRPCMIERT